MKIAVIGKKGGIGKSMLCLLLHEAIRRSGQSVAVRDYDLQGSATKALKAFGGTLEKPGEGYDVLLIDTPPWAGMPSPNAPAASAMESDVILVPTSPAPADFWEAETSVRFAKDKNPDAAIRIVLNRVRAGTLLSSEADANLKAQLKNTSAKVLPVALPERQSFQHLWTRGWSALDSKAVAELLQFTVAVTSLRRR
jgi:chromosome partitioning protein